MFITRGNNDLPHVSVIMCSQPPSINSTLLSVESMVYGGRALYECDAGYRVEGGERVKTCDLKGEWQGDDLQCQGQWGETEGRIQWMADLEDKHDVYASIPLFY